MVVVVLAWPRTMWVRPFVSAEVSWSRWSVAVIKKLLKGRRSVRKLSPFGFVISRNLDL